MQLIYIKIFPELRRSFLCGLIATCFAVCSMMQTRGVASSADVILTEDIARLAEYADLDLLTSVELIDALQTELAPKAQMIVDGEIW